MKRIVLLMLCLLLISGVLCSCAELGEYTVNGRTVMKAGDISISYDVYKYFYNMTVADMGGDATDWTDAQKLSELKQSVEDSIRWYSAQKSLFERYGIKLSSQDKADVDEYIKSYMEEQNGEQGYKKWLAENYISGKFFREQIERVYYYDPYLREILFTGIDNVIKMDDATVIEDVNKNFYHYTQIFVSYGEGDLYFDKKDEIEAAYEALENGEDFSAVSLKYSDWTVNVDRGVYTTKGEKLKEIEETALGLEIGEYSEVVESSEGFHIIKRLPMDDEYILDNLDDLAYISATRRYLELIDSMAETIKVSYNSYYDTLTHEMLTKIEYP